MIEQIYTYFTVEMIYLWLNIGIIPFWLMLIFLPQSNIAKIIVRSIFPIFLLTFVYSYLIFRFYYSDYDFSKSFSLYLSFEHLMDLFLIKEFLILFWIHFLTINLFCGSWIVSDAEKLNINKYIIAIPLIFTYFVGPIGLFIYWFIRIFFARRLSLYD